MSARFISDTNVISSSGVSWLIGGIRGVFESPAEAKIEAFAKKEGFTHACVYKKDGSVASSFTTVKEPKSYFFAENFSGFAFKTNGTKDAICIEECGKNQYLMVVIVGGEIAIDRMCTKAALLKNITEVLKSKDERDRYVGFSGKSDSKSLTFSLYCHGLSTDDYSQEYNDLFDALDYLCDIDNSRNHVNEQSIFSILDKEPLFQSERIKDALSHIRSENGSVGTKLAPVVIFAAVVCALYFMFFYDDEAEVVPTNPYEAYYSAVKNEYVSVYPRLAADYNNLILLEREVPNWGVASIALDKGFTSFKMVPVRSEAKIAELRAFAEKYRLQFDSDSSGYSLLSYVENFAVFSKDYRKIYSVNDVSQLLDDSFVTAIPATQLTLVKDVPNGKPPQMQWVVRELLVNVVSMPFEDLLAIGGILVDSKGRPLPVTIGGDPTSGLSIGTLTVDSAKRTVSGSLTISVFGRR